MEDDKERPSLEVVLTGLDLLVLPSYSMFSLI